MRQTVGEITATTLLLSDYAREDTAYRSRRGVCRALPQCPPPRDGGGFPRRTASYNYADAFEHARVTRGAIAIATALQAAGCLYRGNWLYRVQL